MESRRRSSRAVADKHDPQDLKPTGGECSVGPGGLSSEDDAEDTVSITGMRRPSHCVLTSFVGAERDYREIYHVVASFEVCAHQEHSKTAVQMSDLNFRLFPFYRLVPLPEPPKTPL